MKYSLIVAMIWLLFMKVSLTDGFTMRSTYLCLYFSSGSEKASYTSPSFSFTIGSTLNDLLSRVSSFACTDSWPVWVMKANPLIPIMSPMSRSFLKTVLYMVLSSPGHISSLFMYTCILPDSSCSSMNEAAPIILRDIILPAITTSDMLPFSGSYPSFIFCAVVFTG